MAEAGMSLGSAEDGRTYTQSAERLEVIDVTGAGDVVLASMAYVWGRVPPQVALAIANSLARVAVMHCGTYVVQAADIVAAVTVAVAAGAGVCAHVLQQQQQQQQQQQKQQQQQQQQKQKQKTVFTNGCFDLLHVGHLRLLEDARACGDYLIVGLNSDASVQRLKGPTRPVRSQAARAEMLLALPWVDEVRIFEEDTPAALIAEIRPAVLVKGGDYQLEQIVGREHAGEVRIFPFQDGSENSSSKIIASVLSHATQ
jgi:D-beta-D-heptose 7-phosphate kinase/D-beta-D-heptose 1-phosphate adenosyltransferase